MALLGLLGAACGAGEGEAGDEEEGGLAVGVEGCIEEGADEAAGGVVRFLAPSGNASQALVDDLIPSFEAATGIEVEAEYLPHDSLTQRVMTEFVAGAPSFDVVMFETSWGGQYSPYMADLDEFIENWGGYDEEGILAAARDMGIYEEQTVGAPYRVIGRMLHYRTDLFEEVGLEAPPETFDELLDYAQQLTIDTNGDGEIDVYGLGMIGQQGFGNAYEYTSFLFSAGGEWWDRETYEVRFNDETGMEVMEYYAALLQEHEVVPPEVSTWEWDEWIAGGQNGRYAMSIMHHPYAGPLNDPEESQTAGEWGWADAPGRDSLEQGAPPVGGWLLGMQSEPENQAEALSFIACMTGPEAQLQSAFHDNAPTRASVFEDEEVRDMWPWADAAMSSLERGTPMYNAPEHIEAEEALAVVVSQALIGSLEPQEAAEEGAARLQRIFEESGRYDD